MLITHQKAKHFKCTTCGKRLYNTGGLATHCQQVHKMVQVAVPNAKPGRESTDNNIYGMAGIPPEDLAAFEAGGNDRSAAAEDDDEGDESPQRPHDDKRSRTDGTSSAAPYPLPTPGAALAPPRMPMPPMPPMLVPPMPPMPMPRMPRMPASTAASPTETPVPRPGGLGVVPPPMPMLGGPAAFYPPPFGGPPMPMPMMFMMPPRLPTPGRYGSYARPCYLRVPALTLARDGSRAACP